MRREEKDEAECPSLLTTHPYGIRLAEPLCSTKLVCYGKTISAQQNLDGLHVCDKRRTPRRLLISTVLLGFAVGL